MCSQSWFKYRQGQNIFLNSKPVQMAMGPTQPPNQWVPKGFFPGGYSGQGVKITSHLYLVTILRTGGVIPPLFHIPVLHSQEQLFTLWRAIPWRNTGTRRTERKKEKERKEREEEVKLVVWLLIHAISWRCINSSSTEWGMFDVCCFHGGDGLVCGLLEILSWSRQQVYPKQRAQTSQRAVS